jgi:hypothetical protein
MGESGGAGDDDDDDMPDPMKCSLIWSKFRNLGLVANAKVLPIFSDEKL